MKTATPLRALLLATALALAFPAGALPGQRPGREGYTYLSYTGPEVSLVSPSGEDPATIVNTPVLAGDVLVTGNASRAEAVLADGAIVRLDVRSELRFESLNRTYESDDDRTVLALARGSAAVEVRDVSTRDAALRLDTNDATVLSPARSVFRVEAGRRGTEIYVLAGRVEVNGRGGRALVKAGEWAFVAGDDLEVELADAPRDRFTRFVEDRRARTGGEAARWVGSEYAYEAADLGISGAWVYVPSAGVWAWRPDVEPGWTPYTLGTWRSTPAGLTWVSYEPWGWLPYHYGTWVYDETLGWLWIPDDAYSPAWVAWSYGDDWTGWCPVGWLGGAYGPAYPRSTRVERGHEGGGPWNPTQRGTVEVSRIDPRGWSFVPTSHLGARLLPARDVKRADHVPLPRGGRVVVTTAPIRVPRGTSPGQAVRDTIQRGAPAEAPPRVVRETERRPTEGWRSPSGPLPAPVERRDAARRDVSGDSGWRAPAPRVIEKPVPSPIVHTYEAPVRREPPASPPASPPVSAPSSPPASPREAPLRVVEPARPAAAPVVSAPAPVVSAPVHFAPAPAPPPPPPPPAPAPAPVAAPDRSAAPARDR